jgi:hypothetical protein
MALGNLPEFGDGLNEAMAQEYLSEKFDACTKALLAETPDGENYSRSHSDVLDTDLYDMYTSKDISWAPSNQNITDGTHKPRNKHFESEFMTGLMKTEDLVDRKENRDLSSEPRSIDMA